MNANGNDESTYVTAIYQVQVIDLVEWDGVINDAVTVSTNTSYYYYY